MTDPDPAAPEIRLNQLLAEREDITLATAESCSGGAVAQRITHIAGSSAYFVGGIVSYANDVKQRVLGVPADVLTAHGAVSEQCARHMAEGARSLLNSTIAVSTTGIAGPGGATANKPVGLVYIAISDGTDTHVERHVYTGSRQAVIDASASRALDLLVEAVELALQRYH